MDNLRFPYLPELDRARKDGFTQDYYYENGCLRCLTDPTAIPKIIKITIKICATVRATIHCIEAEDGRHNGTVLEYWD